MAVLYRIPGEKARADGYHQFRRNLGTPIIFYPRRAKQLQHKNSHFKT
jgi:hypothetical protein